MPSPRTAARGADPTDRGRPSRAPRRCRRAHGANLRVGPPVDPDVRLGAVGQGQGERPGVRTADAEDVGTLRTDPDGRASSGSTQVRNDTSWWARSQNTSRSGWPWWWFVRTELAPAKVPEHAVGDQLADGLHRGGEAVGVVAHHHQRRGPERSRPTPAPRRPTGRAASRPAGAGRPRGTRRRAPRGSAPASPPPRPPPRDPRARRRASRSRASPIGSARPTARPRSRSHTQRTEHPGSAARSRARRDPQ